MHNFFKFKLNLLITGLCCITAASGQVAQSNIVDKLWTAIGGKENWQNARYFMFSCIGGDDHSFAQGERKYLWDKQSGNCRFEGMTTDDEAIIALFNIKTTKGTVYINGVKLDNPRTTADIILEIITEFDRDARLLFLPTILEGDGASYAIAGEKLVGSQRFTVIDVKNRKTSFEVAVEGQLYVDTQTGEVLQWRPSQDANQFYIGGFKDIGGGLILPTHFKGTDTTSSITYPLAAALVNIEAQKFNTPLAAVFPPVGL